MDTREFEGEIRMLVEEFVRRLIDKFSSYKFESRIRSRIDVDKLARLFSALSSPGRIMILIALEDHPRRFTELEILSGLRGGSLKNALMKLIDLGLVENVAGAYRITPKGRIVLKRIRGLDAYVRYNRVNTWSCDSYVISLQDKSRHRLRNVSNRSDSL